MTTPVVSTCFYRPQIVAGMMYRLAGRTAAITTVRSASLMSRRNGLVPKVTTVLTSDCDVDQHRPSTPLMMYQTVQLRYFDHRKRRKKRKSKKDPFKVLGIPEASLYKHVKKKFLRIAMANHPDTHDEDMSEEEKEEMRDIFIAARKAFESLVEDDDGTAILKEDAEDAMENFDSWFKSETGLKTPFAFDMDPETMKEVAKMTDELGGDSGLDRDGGMWALARMVRSTVKAGGDASTMLRLEAGDANERDRRINGSLRRRRKR